MTAGSSDLLRRLAGAGAPGAAQATPGRAGGTGGVGGGVGAAGTNGAGVEHASFADLLKRAASGSLGSDQPVQIGDRAGVTLSDDQLGRLALACDRAQALGVQTALVNIDGQALLLDVQARTITGRADLSAGVVSGIDGVITVPGVGEAGADAPLSVPGAGVSTRAALLRALAPPAASAPRAEA